MNTSQLIRANLSSIRKELAEVFPRLTDEMLDWAPADGMRTVHGQFVEIMATEHALVEKLKGTQTRTPEEMDAPFWAVKTLSGLIAKIEEIRQETLDYLDSLDEAELSAPFTVSEGFGKWIELNPAPVSELIRYIGRHESYHSGQLVAYLWARGDDPYKW